MDMNQYACLSVSYKTAPIEVREKLHLRKSCRPKLLSMLRQSGAVAEAALLNTCHRIELYAVGEDGGARRTAMLKSLAKLTGQRPKLVREASAFFVGRDCVTHLFRLVCGLDSMVPGEPQIAWQVKQAYEEAAHHRQLSSCLHTLFQEALKVNKKVRSSTGIDRGNLSLASIAVELLKGKLGKLSRRKVAIFGAGKAAGLVAERLKMEGTSEVLVSNRTYERAVEIASRLGGRAARFDRKEEVLRASEIVITSTSAPHFLIHRDEVERAQKKRRHRPLYMLDLSVPRDIECEAGNLKGVHLFHLDDLAEVAETNRRKRQPSIEAAERLIPQALEEFERELLCRQVAPLIDRYHRQVEEIARREFERALARLRNSESDAESALREALHRAAKKIAHKPTVNLKKLVAKEGSLPAAIFARLMGLRP